MFNELRLDLTPELEKILAEMPDFNINNYDELLQKFGGRLNSSDILIDGGITLGGLIDKWKGPGTQWSVIKGVSILDLASGSALTKNLRWSRNYPSFSRLCALLGANVTAVDIVDQSQFDQKLFKCVKLDLVEVILKGGGLDQHPEFKSRKFDIIHSLNFIGSNPDPGLLRELASLYWFPYRGFEDSLTKQAASLLEEGGVMFLGSYTIGPEGLTDIYHVKKDGKLLET